MKWSLFIGKISSIKIYIHWTFLILILWIIQSEVVRHQGINSILLNLGFVLLVFLCIVLHELGHALTAKRFNIKTKDIILLPIGGVARMEGFPEKPMQEFLVAVMGPAVNIVICAILYVILRISNTFPATLTNFNITTTNFWFQLFSVNLVLALFNFIPAFPMDGGRVLRALLSLKLSRVKATRIAAYAGQFIAILFVFFGISYNPFLVFIGFFIFLGAQAEAKSEETIAALQETKVSDILMHHYSILRSDDSLSKAVERLLDSQDHSFVVEENGEITGTLSKSEIIQGLSHFGKDVSVGRVMRPTVAKLKPGDRLRDVIQTFSDNVEAIMPVFDGKKIVGVLDLENIREFVQIQTALAKS